MEKADKLSKFISLVLRHNPAAAHVTLDEHGWADVEAGVPAGRLIWIL